MDAGKILVIIIFIPYWWHDKMIQTKKTNQSGNILLFILIAILLIGLLTVSLTRSSNQSNDTGDYEQNVIVANEILNYAKSVEIAVQNLLARGCSENDLRFRTGLVNPNCNVYNENGIGLEEYITTSDRKWLIDDTLAWPYRIQHTSRLRVIGVESDTLHIGQELLLFIPNIRQEYCIALNNVLGNENPSNYPPRDDNGSAVEGGEFNGSFSGASNTIETTGGELTGKRSGCFVTDDQAGASNALDGTDYFYFYHTLIAR